MIDSETRDVSLIRADSVFVSWKTRRRLKWIAKAHPTRFGPGESGLTVDELADKYLTETIEQKFPQLKELEKNLENRENEVIERLRNG